MKADIIAFTSETANKAQGIHPRMKKDKQGTAKGGILNFCIRVDSVALHTNNIKTFLGKLAKNKANPPLFILGHL